MIIIRKAILKNAPPLVGTEIAVYVDGVATDLTDGYTFGMSRVNLSSEAESFTVQWGDGSSETYHETLSNVAHTYQRPGLYRVRLCDAIANVTVSGTAGSDPCEIYAPMVRELSMTSTRIHTLARTAFVNAYNLEYVDLRGSAVRTIAAGVFSGCRALSVFEGFEQIERLNMTVFQNCVSLPARIDLPNLVEISAAAIYSPFSGTNIKEFHFAAKNEDTIKSLQFYQETGGNLGVEGAVCYFDL